MTPNTLTPSDIKAFKRQAKRLKRELHCSHMQALELLAREQGFASWHQVQTFVEQTPDPLSSADAANNQRILLESSLYTSVPVGWLIGRKPYPEHVAANTGAQESRFELEVPSSRWQTTKKD